MRPCDGPGYYFWEGTEGKIVNCSKQGNVACIAGVTFGHANTKRERTARHARRGEVRCSSLASLAWKTQLCKELPGRSLLIGPTKQWHVILPKNTKTQHLLCRLRETRLSALTIGQTCPIFWINPVTQDHPGKSVSFFLVFTAVRGFTKILEKRLIFYFQND